MSGKVSSSNMISVERRFQQIKNRNENIRSDNRVTFGDERFRGGTTILKALEGLPPEHFRMELNQHDDIIRTYAHGAEEGKEYPSSPLP